MKLLVYRKNWSHHLVHESHFIFPMCFKIANEGQALYKAWHMCKKRLSSRIWFFISLFFWTSDTAHLSLVSLDHISPQKQNRRQQDRLAFFLPKDFKGRSLMPYFISLTAPEPFSEIANAKWKPRTVTKALRFPLPLTPPLSRAGLSCKPAKTTAVRNSTVEKAQVKHPLVPSHSSSKSIRLDLTCLSKTHSGEAGIVQCTPEWDNRLGHCQVLRKGQKPEVELGTQGSCLASWGSCNSSL